MIYFPEFTEVTDPIELQGVGKRYDLPSGSSRLPFDYIDDRRFEILAYRLKWTEFDAEHRVRLMQAVGERGRDVVVYGPDGRVVQIVQCKNLRARLTLPEARRELLKLAIHAAKEPGIVGEQPITYELWCPGDLAEKAAALFDTWPNAWTEANLRDDAAAVLRDHAKLKGTTWAEVQAFVVDSFPRLVTPKSLSNVDVTTRVRQSSSVLAEFFNVQVVMDPTQLQAVMNAMVAKVGGFALGDDDAKHVLERVTAFPNESRIMTLSGYLMGVSHELAGRLTNEEFQELATQAIGPSFNALILIIKACSRLAMETSGDFRMRVKPIHPGVAPVLGQVLNHSAIAKLNPILSQGLNLQPALEAYTALSFEQRFENDGRLNWDSYQRCLEGYDRQKHAPGSDPELRYRCALVGLGGAKSREEFETALFEAFRRHATELKETFDSFMKLVPSDLMVVSDTFRMFKDRDRLLRMHENLRNVERVRKETRKPS